MKASDLVTVWSAPDNSRMTAKQYSFRLPVHIAAKLSALEDIYPTKSRTQLVGDLLSAAIADVEQNLPSRKGKFWANDPETDEKLFVAEGMAADFRTLANKYYQAIEREMGNESPELLYESTLLVHANQK